MFGFCLRLKNVIFLASKELESNNWVPSQILYWLPMLDGIGEQSNPLKNEENSKIKLNTKVVIAYSS